VLVAFVSITSFLYFYSGDMFSSIENCKRKYYCLLSLVCLLFVAIVFIIVKVFGVDDIPFFMIAASTFLIMFVVSNLFYEGRVFAGGDAKLLFAMSVLFVGVSFFGTLINIGIFLLFLMFSGSIYGLLYSFVLYAKDYKKVNREMRKGFGKLWIRFAIVLGVVLFALSYFDWLFLFPAILFLLLPMLYVFAKGLETVSMIRIVSGKELREGDWLVNDVKVKGKVIRANWDGLSLKDIGLLKGKKNVKIKEGLPFVPAFLIAFLGYVFLKGGVVSFLIGLA
jgi:hypothetical protein